MAIYAISDLHLSFSDSSKSMEFFGKEWNNYVHNIKKNWIDTVKENDTVLIAGDISWAINIEDAKLDFEYINSLPGNKIIIKGNHDYYFSTMKKVESFLKKNNFNTIKVLHNNSFEVEDYNICGTRGWGNIAEADSKINNKKIIDREAGRLKISLDSIENKNKKILVMMHFPPFYPEFKRLMEEYNVSKCIYGHLHGDGHCMVKEGDISGIEYIMTSCDYTKFKLVKIN